MPVDVRTLEIGLVMPIAPIDDCTSEHWIDVKSIIEESVNSIPGYKCNVKIVSEGDSSGLIHKRIVQGLYNSHIVICDVSCKNPNVMFELGMRLAFDKPTIIIKDDHTTYTFDPGGIEHLNYPRDLRFNKIVDFKSQLAKKVQATFEDSLSDPNHSPFLKSFGQFKVATIEQTSVPADTLMLQMMMELQSDMDSIKRDLKTRQTNSVKTYKLKDEVFDNIETAVIEYTHKRKMKTGFGDPNILIDLASFVESYLELKGLTGKGLPRQQLLEIIEDFLKYKNMF